MNDFIDKFNTVPMAQRVLGLIVLLVIFAVGFYSLALMPLQNEISSSEQQLVKLQRERERLEQLKRNRAVVLRQLEKLKRQLLIAQEKLPQDAEIPSLLQRIHNQAKTAGLEITSFKRNPDVAKNFYVEIPVLMDLSGTYDELANFLFYVGRMTRIVNVKNLNLAALSSGMHSDGELKISAVGTTFRYAKPGAPPAGKPK